MRKKRGSGIRVPVVISITTHVAVNSMEFYAHTSTPHTDTN